VRGSESADRSNAIEVKAPVPEGQKPTMYALSIGINYQWDAKLKENPGALMGAENDARTMSKALRENCAGSGERFRFRAVEGGDPLLGKEATGSAILNRLKEIRQKGPKPGDLVVIFYAGHGVAENREFYLLTADLNPNSIENTCLSGSKLRDALKSMPCQVLLIFDACQSGQALNRFAPATDELGRSLADDEAGVTVLGSRDGPRDRGGEGRQRPVHHGPARRTEIQFDLRPQPAAHERASLAPLGGGRGPSRKQGQAEPRPARALVRAARGDPEGRPVTDRPPVVILTRVQVQSPALDARAGTS